MHNPPMDVLTIGNAIVDIVSKAEPKFLVDSDFPLGSMNLITEGQAQALHGKLTSMQRVSGGSAANTAVGIASLGGKASYIGKVKDDEMGKLFAADLEKSGVGFSTPFARSGPSTAVSFVLVTPDAQRTMATYLGACHNLTPHDIDESVVANAEVSYLEGYLWDPPLAKDAFRKVLDVARRAGKTTSLSLSDTFCVDRYRDEFLELLLGDVDILFANETELLSLYKTRRLNDALEHARSHCQIVAITQGKYGSIVASGNETYQISAETVYSVVDTTGAGDLYAAGFLFGLSRRLPLCECGKIASMAAAEVISHYGARPKTSLADYLR